MRRSASVQPGGPPLHPPPSSPQASAVKLASTVLLTNHPLSHRDGRLTSAFPTLTRPVTLHQDPSVLPSDLSTPTAPLDLICPGYSTRPVRYDGSAPKVTPSSMLSGDPSVYRTSSWYSMNPIIEVDPVMQPWENVARSSRQPLSQHINITHSNRCLRRKRLPPPLRLNSTRLCLPPPIPDLPFQAASFPQANLALAIESFPLATMYFPYGSYHHSSEDLRLDPSGGKAIATKAQYSDASTDGVESGCMRWKRCARTHRR